MKWCVHHRIETASTNLDAREGCPGDVFTADYQTAGRGRLDHRWVSPQGVNLLMSAVMEVKELPPEEAATLPLVAGLAVVRAVEGLVSGGAVALKWPNDVWVDGRKIAGILCERHRDDVIVGIGVNVLKQDFPPAIADRATTLADHGFRHGVSKVRDAVLKELDRACAVWRRRGFAALHGAISEYDALKGMILQVQQTDDDREPICGLCGGVLPDGSLSVAGRPVYAGEAHIMLRSGGDDGGRASKFFG